MRIDLSIIDKWVQPNHRVLDLGCGDGSLLQFLKQQKNIRGYGLEISPDRIEACIQKGINVIEQNLDDGLTNFDDDSFDLVIMDRTLPAMRNPKKVLQDMMRVGRECVVTIPNFGYWRTRLQLLFKGRMPVSDLLPYEWYDTPNIHFCTFHDFEVLCRDMQLQILDTVVISKNSTGHFLSQINPNLCGESAIFRLRK